MEWFRKMLVSRPLGTLLFCMLIGLGQPLVSSAQQYSTTTYGEAAGLANLNISNILESRSGRMWVGTENGLYLANGSLFEKQTAFQHAGIEQIHSISEDADGRLWVLDSDSLAYQEAGEVHAVPALHASDVTSDSVLMSLEGDRDAIFLLSHGSLLRVFTADRGRSWQVRPALSAALLGEHPELAAMTTITVGGRSSFWAGCGGSLCLVDLAHLTVQVKAPPAGLAAQRWACLHVARNGAVWARSAGELAVLNPSSNEMMRVAKPAGVRFDAKVPVIQEDDRGRILLNLGKGIARMEGGRWQILDERNGLPRQELESLIFTPAGDVWMGVVGHGITVWRGYDQWESWTETQGMSSPVIWPMANDRHHGLWVATDTSIDKIDLVSHRVTSVAARMPSSRVTALITDRRDHVWAANSAGELYDIDSLTGSARLAGRELGKTSKLLEDGSGTVWVCARTGLYAVTSADGWKRPTRVGPDQLPDGSAWYITQGNAGSLWLSAASGLYRLVPGGRWTHIALPPTSLSHFMVAEAKDGTLWMQNLDPSPLLHMRVSGDTAVLLDKEATSTLGSDNLTFLDVDSRGWLWVGSDAGVSVFNGNRWIRLNMEDGLVWDDTDFHALHEDPNGSMWIGTTGGVAHLLHPERLFETAPPVIHFQSADVGGKPLLNGDATGITPRVLDLPRADFNVRLLNTSYERGGGIQYRYRLDGLEDAWQSSAGVIRYPMLSDGSYRLSVVAYDVRRHQASAPAIISFRLLAPWWRRPWSLALEGLMVLLLLAVGWRSRVRLLIRRQQLLERLVEERTGELQKEKKELIGARADILAMARRDSLTNLLNRGAIFEEMQRMCEDVNRTGKPLAYVMADLDSFKQINDAFGHVAGDAVLRDCATRIHSELQSGEVAGRYGGEEMLILLPEVEPAKLHARIEELRLAIAENPVIHDETPIKVTCSFGVAWFQSESFSLERLIKKADEALYRAKKNGRNRAEFALFPDAQMLPA